MNVLLVFLLVPVGVLLWRVVYSKSRWPRRIGAAAAAMFTLVGALVAEPGGGESLVRTMRIVTLRDALITLAAASGSTYLLLWGLRHRGRARNKTISILAAVIGYVPIIASVAVAILYPER